MKLYFDTACLVKDCLYFTTVNTSWLFKADLETRKISKCIDLLVSIGQVNKYAKILHHKECLWLIPRNALYILKYKILDNSVVRYYIPHEENKLGIRYRDAVCVNGKIYALPEKGNSIRVFKLEDNSCYSYKVPVKQENNFKRFFWSMCTDEKKLYLLADESSYSYRINLETMQADEWKKRECFDGAWHAECIEGYIYTMPYKENILYKHEINSIENRQTILLDKIKVFTYKDRNLGFVPIQILTYKDGKKILISYIGNKFLVIDSNYNIITQEEISYDENLNDDSLQNYLKEIVGGDIRYWKNSERLYDNKIIGQKIWSVFSNR